MRRNYANKINKIISDKLKNFREINIKYNNDLFDDLNEKKKK